MLARSLVLTVAALVATLPLTAAAAPTQPPIGGNGGRGMAVLRPCASAQLKAAVAAQTVTAPTGATSHRELRITLSNVSARPCAIDGFAAVRLLDELKNPQIVAESFSGTPHLFIIEPSHAAAFLVRIATGDGTTSYRTVPMLAVIPPGDTSPIVLNADVPVAPTIEVTALAPASLVQFAGER